MPTGSKWANVQLIFCSWLAAESMMRFLGLPVLLLSVIVSAVAVATMYVVRFEPTIAAQWAARPWPALWMDWICNSAKMQRPSDVRHASPDRGMRAQTREDFVQLVKEVKQDVYGHETTIAQIAATLGRLFELRRHCQGRDGLTPLATILLAGRRGTGKRHMAMAFGTRLFHGSQVSTFDLARIRDAKTLFGGNGIEGELISRIKSYPRHIVILDGLEAAEASVLESLADLLQHGSWNSHQHGIVRFQDCVFFLIAHEANSQDPDESRDNLLQRLNIPTRLGHRIDECLSLRPLTDEDRAQVVIGLAYDVCQRYGLDLAYIDPALVLREIENMSDEHEFATSVNSIERWLRQPIHTATRNGLRTLVLTADWVDSLTPRGNDIPSETVDTPRLPKALIRSAV